MRKIIAVIENFDDSYGGPSSSISGLLVELARKRFFYSEILSVRLKDEEKNSSFDLSEGCLSWDNECKLFGFRKFMFSFGFKKKLEEKVREGDVVYINNLWNYVSYISYKVAKKNKAKLVFAPRGSLYDWSLSQRKFIKRLALFLFQKRHLDNADFIHVTCQEEFDAVRALGIRSKIKIIPHGVNKSIKVPDTEDSYEKLNLSSDYRYFLFMSRLHKKKGLDSLIDYWSEKSKSNPKWKLLIAGPDYGGYKGKIHDELGSSAVYLGECYGELKKHVLEVSEFLVLPSFSENFGVVIAESLSASTPVVTSDNTPWSELQSSGAGYCVSLDVFYSYVGSMLDSGVGDLKKMGLSGQDLVEKEYSWSSRALTFNESLNES